MNESRPAFEITVEGTFSATHALRHGPGQCEPVHGHDWRVTVNLAAARLDDRGFVADFEDVRRKLGEVLAEMHHRHLNDHSWFAGVNPSAEVVARVIYRMMSDNQTWGDKVSSVTVGEAPGCTARYHDNRCASE